MKVVNGREIPSVAGELSNQESMDKLYELLAECANAFSETVDGDVLALTGLGVVGTSTLTGNTTFTLGAAQNITVDAGTTDHTGSTIINIDLDVNSASCSAVKVDLDVGTALSNLENAYAFHADVAGIAGDNAGASIVAFYATGATASGAPVVGVQLAGAWDTGIELTGTSTTGIYITGNSTIAFMTNTGTFGTCISLAGTITTAIAISACTTGISFDGSCTTALNLSESVSKIMVAGTSSNKITNDASNVKFVQMYLDCGSTTGEAIGIYDRLYVTGAGGSGIALRAFCSVQDVAAVDARGAHISLNFGATGTVTGSGQALTTTLHIANQATQAGTLSSLTCEISSDGANSDPNGARLSFIRFANTGDTTGDDDVETDAAIFDFQGCAVANGNIVAVDSSPGAAPNITHSVRCRDSAGTLFYLYGGASPVSS